MQNVKCPTCGHETGQGAASPGCEHAGNGAAKPKWIKPPPPPELAEEVASWVITPTPPEMLEQLRREVNEEEWTAALREVEQGGGHRFEDFIDEIERIANGHE